MLVCQILDAQFVKPTFAVELPSVTPKLVPKIVMNPPCDVGPFTGLTWVTTGELYEKALLLAPALPPTMTPAATCGPKPGATWHSSKDPETQAILEQLVAPIRTVAEMSTAPKFLPDRVRLAPPLSGAFAGETDVMAGESYEKAWDKVPITSSSTLVFRAVPTPKLAVQTMDVAVSQRFDVHTVDPTRTLAPGAGPKLVPDSVRRAPPSVGPFLGAKDVMTPWSYVKADLLHPGTDARVTVAVRALPNPGCGAHRRKESVTQTFEPQEVAPNRTDGPWFVGPKFMPVRRAVLAPVDGVFAGVTNVTTGAS